jgi:hypothetical protein
MTGRRCGIALSPRMQISAWSATSSLRVSLRGTTTGPEGHKNHETIKRVCNILLKLLVYIHTMRTLTGKGKGSPLQAQAASWGSRRLRLLDLLDIRHYEGGKVVTLTHRPPLPPGVFLVLIFRGWVDPRAQGTVEVPGKNPQWNNRVSIPKLSDLTTTLPQAPHE